MNQSGGEQMGLATELLKPSWCCSGNVWNLVRKFEKKKNSNRVNIKKLETSGKQSTGEMLMQISCCVLF